MVTEVATYLWSIGTPIPNYTVSYLIIPLVRTLSTFSPWHQVTADCPSVYEWIRSCTAFVTSIDAVWKTWSLTWKIAQVSRSKDGGGNLCAADIGTSTAGGFECWLWIINSSINILSWRQKRGLQRSNARETSSFRRDADQGFGIRGGVLGSCHPTPRVTAQTNKGFKKGHFALC